jgi:hypothetical protein
MQGSRTTVDPAATLAAHVARAPAPLGAPDANWAAPLWAGAETVEVGHWEWPNPSGPESKEIHRPKVLARTLWDDGYLAVSFQVEDSYVRCQHTEFQAGVCQDSCCEFFVAPAPDSDGGSTFFNFEVNAAATMLLYRCVGGGCRDITALPAEDGATIKMASSLFGAKTAADPGKPIEPENSHLPEKAGVHTRYIARRHTQSTPPHPVAQRWQRPRRWQR